MSLKFYNGSIVKNMEFSVFFYKLQNCRKEFKNILNKNFNEETIKLFFNLYDLQNVQGYIEKNITSYFSLDKISDFNHHTQIENNKYNSFNILDDFIKKTFIKNKETFTPFYNDLIFKLNIIPFSKDKILILNYGNDDCFNYIKKNIKEIEDYSYWNNNDKDEDVTDKEWENRKIDWSMALKENYYIPKESSLIFNIDEEDYNLSNLFNEIKNNNLFNIKKFYPSIDERIKNVKSKMLKKIYNNLFSSYNNENHIIYTTYLNGYINYIEYEEKLNKFLNDNEDLKIYHK